MQNFINKIKIFFQDHNLRRRVIVTLGILVIFRLLATIPVPGVDAFRLSGLLASNQFLGLLNVFSGGGLSNLSIIMLGVGPYITGSIIMQLLTIMSPKLKAMYQEEGEAGRMKFAQYSRIITVPLAIIQAFSFIILLQRQEVLSSFSPFQFFVNILMITAGSMLLMWIGELVSEFGIGNGISLIIFSGIVSQLPSTLGQAIFSFDISNLPTYIGFAVATVAMIVAVVIITEAERPIPVTYAKRVRGQKVYGGISTYIPLRLNQAGVIPIIFALSILLFPQMIFNFIATSKIAFLQSFASFGLNFVSNQLFYGITYFLLVFIFTYFYTAVTFDPDSISTNLQKNGAFIPGVRPGQPTSEHIAKILTRLTLFGALFLGVIAVMPLIMKAVTGIASLAIGGTALLIVVSVVIDLIKKVDAQVSLREY